MEPQGLQGPRIALLIDFDNVVLGVDDPPGFDIELVVNALRSRGIVVLGRAYGDWYRHSRHRRKLMEQGIELVETPAFGPIIKNSADIRIALDGLEIGMTQHHINEFCLVSGDSDFLPLIKRLQYLGKTVVVISGTKFTADLVRRNCNEFISYENLLAESVGATEDATTLDGALALLARSIGTLHERGMEVRSSTVKQMMIQLNPVFSERNFQCSQFKQFLDKGCKAGVIKLGRRDPNSGEYTVLLPTDFDDEPTSSLVEEEAKTASRTRRGGRTRRVQQADEDLGLHDLTSESTTGDTPAATASEVPATNGDATTNRTLRRGRLRFSGKTWKGGSRSILQSQQNGDTKREDATAQEQSTSPAEKATSEQGVEMLLGETIGEATPALEESAIETAGNSTSEAAPKAAPRKRSTRGGNRRKTTAKSGADGTAEAPEVAPADLTEAPSVDPAEAESSQENPEGKKAAKKATRRRRAPAKKKTDSK